MLAQTMRLSMEISIVFWQWGSFCWSFGWLVGFIYSWVDGGGPCGHHWLVLDPVPPKAMLLMGAGVE